MTRLQIAMILSWTAFLAGGPALAKLQAQSAGSLQASNLLNPNLSAVGWFQGEAGHGQPPPAGSAPESPFQLKEAEIGLQSAVDPYARADIFAAVEGGGEVELEEATLTWFTLPYDLALKAGKFRANWGKFNRTHPPETAFADRPRVHENLFGGEGLSGAGGSLSWQIPNPWLFLNLDAEIMGAPESKQSPAFEAAAKRDALTLGRLSGYWDFNEEANVTLGTSFASGPAGQAFDAATNSSDTLRSRVYGLDMTFRWKNPRRAIYRSLLWQTEAMWNDRQASPGSYRTSSGFFTHLDYQFARRWRAGGRYDWSQSPQNDSKADRGGLLYLTFTPSEFSLISLQGKTLRRAGGEKESQAFLKVTFNIGPHGTHPF